MDLNEIAIFIKVAQLKSFSAAAINLNLPKSTVSTKISNLEKRLGVRLIHRTTRQINLTPIGKEFYNRSITGIENLKKAEDEVIFSKESPTGKLVISAPIFLGNYLLPDVICDYKKEFPEVDIELILTDRSVDIVSEGVDLAIRAGKLPDSSLISRKMGQTSFALFCAADYFKKKLKLTHPAELQHHACLQFAPLGKNEWTLFNAKDKQTVTIPMKKTFVADDIYIIKNLTIQGQGISLLPSFLCKEELRSKELINILPNWTTDIKPIYFVYPHSRYILSKTKKFIEKAEKIFKHSISFNL